MPGPTTPIIDSGVRADENPAMGWTDSIDGGTYGNVQIVSNQIVPTSGEAYPYHSGHGVTGDACEVYATDPTVGSNTDLLLRLSSVGTGGVDGYVLYHDATDFYVYRMDNNSYVQLGAAIPQTQAAGMSYLLRAVGPVLTVEHRPPAGSWAHLATRIDGTYTAGGYLGMYMRAGAAAITDFGGGTTTLSPVRRAHV